MNNKFIPKVEFFREPPEDMETKMTLRFLGLENKNNRNIQSLFEALPDLKNSLQNAIKKHLAEKRENWKDDIDKELIEIKEDWCKIENSYLNRLSELFETEWTENKNIKGYISIISPHPRFLDDYSFFVSNRSNFSSAKEISAHEILHFLWFKKWKEVFPETKQKEMENPYLVWKISEIIDPIILQTDPIIKELIEPRSWGYKIFDSINLEGVKMQEYFTKIYLDSRNAGDSFDVTMKKIYEEAKLHEKELDF